MVIPWNGSLISYRLAWHWALSRRLESAKWPSMPRCVAVMGSYIILPDRFVRTVISGS